MRGSYVVNLRVAQQEDTNKYFRLRIPFVKMQL